MALDAPNISYLAGGHSYQPPPFVLEGIRIEPSVVTRSSQATGDGSTKLVARYRGGRVRIGERASDLRTTETVIANTSGAQYKDQALTGFASGNALWCTLVAHQPRPGSDIKLVWVPGAIAVLASVAKPTHVAIKAALSGSEAYVILGDLRFHRKSDLVVKDLVDESRRPAWVDDANKVSVSHDQDDQSKLGKKFWGFLEFPIDLVALSAKSAGDLYVDGAALPVLSYGGELGAYEYVGVVAGGGAGADLTLRLGIKGTAFAGNDRQLLLVGTAIPSVLRAAAAYASVPKFMVGDDLDIELEAKATVFTSGSGVLRIEVWEYVP